MSTKTKTPAHGLKFTHNGHRYQLDGKPVTGVTTLIGGGIPKPALIAWAPRVVAEWVTNPNNRTELDSLLAGDRDHAVRELKSIPTKERDSAGERGTEVHHYAEIVANHGEIDVPEDLAGFIEGYVAFLEAWQITVLHTEVSVGNRTHWYAGTLDMICTSPFLAGGMPVMIDLKTSKSVYGETALQNAAYSRAEFHGLLGDEHPLPNVAATYVAHVTPMDREGLNARYEGKPLGTSLYQLADSPEQIDAQFQEFLTAAYIHKTNKQREGYITEPLVAPTHELKAA
ncbi:hypothetical protein ACSYDW_07240 [Paeniglutamicibacter sp. R2-26]|uniref:hypothetical protein n=1 Tax=Paeniglutamicibacter sp. R2-26 TaxID=3144417 RepID=UPI003EE7ACCB